MSVTLRKLFPDYILDLALFPASDPNGSGVDNTKNSIGNVYLLQVSCKQTYFQKRHLYFEQ